MSLVRDENQVYRLTTDTGWVFKIVPGTFRTEVVREGGEPVTWFTFDAYGKVFGTTEHIAIRQSEVSRIMEAGESL